MQMPPSFKRIISGMTTSDLKELLEFNSRNQGANKLANEVIAAELAGREGTASGAKD
jgi:hypothetical protein